MEFKTMPTIQFEYRGVDVQVREMIDLHALMRVQGDQLLIPRYPQATRKEGIPVLVSRVKADIDEYLSELRR
jgi:hypothetical protein